jgi:hypothetical protein
VSCDEDLLASLADAAALDSRRNLKPGRQKSLQVPWHLRGCSRWTVLEDVPSLRTGNRISEAGLVIHHSWRRALTQCRARYHISIHPCGRPSRMQVHSFRHGDWSLPAIPLGIAREPVKAPYLVGGRRTRVSILDSLAGSGRICWHWSGFAGSDLPNAAALTLRIDLTARAPFRAVERLISPIHRTFGPWLATASMVSR